MIWERIRPGLTIIGVAMLMLMGSGLLQMIGWQYDSTSAPNLIKIHPSTYVIALAALVTIVARRNRSWACIKRPNYIMFAFAVFVLLVRAIFIGLSGQTNGELSAVIVTFLTPLLLIIALYGMDSADLTRLAVPLRVFFVINSTMALGERFAHRRFIPSWLDTTTDDRAAALVSHPLNGSMLCGLMIIYLVTARRARVAIAWRIPELILHTAGMFAFGGRSALVFTAMTIMLSAFLNRNQANVTKLSTLQRALPFLIIAVGAALMFLPIPFVDATLDRFSNDNRSAATRDAAVQMLAMLSPGELAMGIDGIRRTIIMEFFHSDFGIELAWIALIMSYGLIATLPMMVGLPLMLFRTARTLDRSAFYMCVMFLLTSAGALSFGTKSTQISWLITLLYILCQPIHGRRRSGARNTNGGGMGLGLSTGERGGTGTRSRRTLAG